MPLDAPAIAGLPGCKRRHKAAFQGPAQVFAKGKAETQGAARSTQATGNLRADTDGSRRTAAPQARHEAFFLPDSLCAIKGQPGSEARAVKAS